MTDDEIVAPSQIPDVIAVNVAVQCTQCHHIVLGNPFWTIRKSAYLHQTGCKGAMFALDATLAKLTTA